MLILYDDIGGAHDFGNGVYQSLGLASLILGMDTHKVAIQNKSVKGS